MTLSGVTASGSKYTVSVINRPANLNVSESLLALNGEAAIKYIGEYLKWQGTLDIGIEFDINNTVKNWEETGNAYACHGGHVFDSKSGEYRTAAYVEATTGIDTTASNGREIDAGTWISSWVTDVLWKGYGDETAYIVDDYSYSLDAVEENPTISNSGEMNFFAVMVHEIFHGLGFWAINNPTFSPFDFDIIGDNGYVTGTNINKVLGTSMPWNLTQAHHALGDSKHNLMYERKSGAKYQITNLDLAVLADYGWEIYKWAEKFVRLSANNNVVSTGADEGESITINIDTDHIVGGATYNYSISGISDSDLSSGSTNGSVTVDSDGDTTITFGLKSDALTEGIENLIFSIDEESITIPINDTSLTNQTPSNISLSSSSFNEHIAAASTVATLSTTDADSSDTHTYSLVTGSGDTDNDSFTIDGSSLKIKASPDYETKSSYNIRLQTTDSSGETYAKTFTLSVNDIDEFTATISGTSSTDSLQSTSGNDSIDGLGGTDTVTYTASFSNYSFTRGTDTLQIADQRTTGTTDGTDTLKNIEYIQFTDQTVEESKVDVVKTYSGNFSDYKFYNKGNGKYEIKTDSGYDDITGYPLLTFTGEATTSSFRDVSAIVDIKGTFDQVTGLDTDDAKMFRLYNASFKRLPDPDGLKYWIGKYSSGENDSRAVASSFLVSAEFKERYGENVSNAKYVETLYTNVLGRDYDQDGYNYWLGNLNAGTETRYELLLGFAEAAENKALFTEMTGFG